MRLGKECSGVFLAWPYGASENGVPPPRVGRGTAGPLCLGNPRCGRTGELPTMKRTWSFSDIRKLNEKNPINSEQCEVNSLLTPPQPSRAGFSSAVGGGGFVTDR